MDIYSKYVNEGLRSALTSQLIFNKCWGECATWGWRLCLLRTPRGWRRALAHNSEFSARGHVRPGVNLIRQCRYSIAAATFRLIGLSCGIRQAGFFYIRTAWRGSAPRSSEKNDASVRRHCQRQCTFFEKGVRTPKTLKRV